MTLNRRTFLGSSVLGLGGLALSSAAKAAPAPKTFDEDTDIVVVGSGFAGLTAAYVAKKAGADVAVLEKMAVAGGNSAINGGIMGVVGSELKRRKESRIPSNS